MNSLRNNMNKNRSLSILFYIDLKELVLNDFIGLFECAETFSRHIIEYEAYVLSSELNLPYDLKLNTLHKIHQVGRRLLVPIEVLRVEKGSWCIEIVIPGAAILWILKKYINPVVEEVWNDSRLREIIVTFLREKIFLESKRTLEQKAIEKRNFRGLQVKKIKEIDIKSKKAGIKIDLSKREILEVELTEKELIEDFIKQLKK